MQITPELVLLRTALASPSLRPGAVVSARVSRPRRALAARRARARHAARGRRAPATSCA